MQPLSYFVPFFILFFSVFMMWNLFEHSRFTRFEGNLKRGVKIWVEPLPWETHQWLEMMPADFQDKQGFIRKEGREVLILAKDQPYDRCHPVAGYSILRPDPNGSEIMTPAAQALFAMPKYSAW
jgi:hypothetical protein